MISLMIQPTTLRGHETDRLRLYRGMVDFRLAMQRA